MACRYSAGASPVASLNFRFEEAAQARDIRARIFGDWDDADW